MNFICDHPDIRAISFVGGDPAGRHIYNRGSANGKRVQVLLRLSNLTLTLTIIFSVVQHGGQEPWSDHARCQQGICCQPGAWLIFIPLPRMLASLHLNIFPHVAAGWSSFWSCRTTLHGSHHGCYGLDLCFSDWVFSLVAVLFTFD